MTLESNDTPKYQICFLVDFQSETGPEIIYVMGRLGCAKGWSSWELTRGKDVETYPRIARVFPLYILHHILSPRITKHFHPTRPDARRERWAYFVERSDIDEQVHPAWKRFFVGIHAAIDTHGRQETAALRIALGKETKDTACRAVRMLSKCSDHMCLVAQARCLENQKHEPPVGILQRTFNRSTYRTDFSANVASPVNPDDIFVCDWANVYEHQVSSWQLSRKKSRISIEGMARQLKKIDPQTLRLLRLDPNNPEQRKMLCLFMARCTDYARRDLDQPLVDLLDRYLRDRSPMGRDEEIPPFSGVLAACARQVDEEITTMVGTRYIPQLYVHRSIETLVEQLIYPESVLNALAKEATEPGLVQRPSVSASREEKRRWVLEALLPAQMNEDSASRKPGLAEWLRSSLPKSLQGRVHLLVSGAGSGKTNTLCHLAKRFRHKQPLLFLTGRSGIAGGLSIKELLEARLRRVAPELFSGTDALLRLGNWASTNDTEVLIFLDAINEHTDIDIMNTSIAGLITDIKDRPFVVIASCRNIYWPFFDTSLWDSKRWAVCEGQIGDFSEEEAERARKTYFEFYKLSTEGNPQYWSNLRNPLMLRFFCETYGDPKSQTTIPTDDIRRRHLKDLFDDYLEKKREFIRHLAPTRRRTANNVERFLLKLSAAMRVTKTTQLSRNAIPMIAGENDLESPNSIYVALLGEDILTEELPLVGRSNPNVRFTYEAFFEYLAAKSMIPDTQVIDHETVKALVEECVKGLEAYPRYQSILFYLVIMLREEFGITTWRECIDGNRMEVTSVVRRALLSIDPERLNYEDFRGIEALTAAQKGGHAICDLLWSTMNDWYNTIWREEALNVLVHFLGADDAGVRATALRGLQVQGIGASNAVVEKASSWFNAKIEAAKHAPIVFLENPKYAMFDLKGRLSKQGFTAIHHSFGVSNALEVIKNVKPLLIILDSLSTKEIDDLATRILPDLDKNHGRVPIIGLITDEKDNRILHEGNIFCTGLLRPMANINQLIDIITAQLAGKYTCDIRDNP